MDPATRVLFWLITVALVFFALGVWSGVTAAMRAWSTVLVKRVREIMNKNPAYKAEFDDAVRELRTLLAIDGHRLPRHVRDAANVWLAEREAEK